MISDSQIDQLAAAVERGDLTEAQASALVRDAVFTGGAAAAPPTPHRGSTEPPKPWASLIQRSQLTDRGIVERQLRREGLGELDVAKGLIHALETNYEAFQQTIADGKAADKAQRESAAEHRWLTETEDGRQERERRVTAEAASILQAEADAKTRAEAARVILEKREGLGDTSSLSDAEVTDAVFGQRKPDLADDLAANHAATGQGGGQ